MTAAPLDLDAMEALWREIQASDEQGVAAEAMYLRGRIAELEGMLR